ncbi:hypothetical protein LOD99_14287 [Oopsacas minuta]|uniref:protein-tyrosine-phosphatase n=1 Tax=Oopsacas minuta TaxID=111878 RepID=A0AAV7KF39_9METZ|nr:hypothetical protein LOD99_14287 [Oopsacas minuta]
MGVFRLITVSLLFAVSSFAFAQSSSNSDPFSLILSQCCGLTIPTPTVSSSNMSYQYCSDLRFNTTINATLCNKDVTELKQCISVEAINQGFVIQNINRTNNIIDIIYTYNCNTYILFWIFVVVVFLFLCIIPVILVAVIICIIMQNQRKRKLHLRGIPCQEVNILTVENGMEHTNKRTGLNSSEIDGDARIHSGNLSTEAYQNNAISSVPSRLEENCYSFTSHFTEATSTFVYETSNHFDFSPPRSPAPVSHKSSVFTFDLPDRLEHEMSSVIEPITPANLLEDIPAFSLIRADSLVQNDPVSLSQCLYQRSQSACVSSEDMNSQQLGLRRGIQLKLDLTYENQTDLSSNEKSLNLSRRISAEQLIQILTNEEDLSTEYSSVPMNKDKVAIPGTGHKNRYPDILPNRCSRVILRETNSDVITGYINANHICSLDKNKSYIAAQGPLKHTADDFWRMVIEKNSSIIVMITTIEETDQSRCYKYWPQNGESECYGRTKVTFISQSRELDYVKTYFKVSLTQSMEYKLVTHYRYTTWPDHGVPSSPDPILKLIREVNSININSVNSPIIIHCSAGVGRTGCYIAIDIGQEQLIKSSSVDILGTLCSMRRERGTMIQTFDQYLFVYHALSHFTYTEQLISPRMRNDYQRFISSMMSPISGFPPKFYNSSNKLIDELNKGTNVMETSTPARVPHHEILTTPSINTNSSALKSFSFIEPELPQPQCNSASYQTKDKQFNFPDTSRKLRSCEHTAFPFGNLTIRSNTPSDHFPFTFSDNNLGKGCVVPPNNESTTYSSFTWPSGVKRIPVTSGSPITPRTPTLLVH